MTQLKPILNYFKLEVYKGSDIFEVTNAVTKAFCWVEVRTNGMSYPFPSLMDAKNFIDNKEVKHSAARTF